MNAEQVVHVAADDETLAGTGCIPTRGVEHAGVGAELSEPEILEPREQAALPAPPRLRHPVDGLLYAVDALLPVRADRAVAGRRAAIHRLTGLELSLQEGCDEIPSVQMKPALGSDGGEETNG